MSTYESKLQRIKTQLDSLASEVDELKKESRYYQNIIDLDAKEKQILELVRDRPGIHQEGIVESISTSSRMPTINRINRLRNNGYIIARQTPKAHKFGIFLNQDNEVLSVTNEMEDFNRALSILLVRISQKISTIEKQNKNILGDVGYEGKSQTDEDLKQILTFLHYSVCEKFVLIYTSRAMFLWTHKLHDNQTLSNLYYAIIPKVIEMRQEVINFEQELKQIHPRYFNFFNTHKPEHFSIGSISYDKEICTDNDYRQEVQLFEKYCLKKEIILVLGKLYDINYKYAKSKRFIEGTYNGNTKKPA